MPIRLRISPQAIWPTTTTDSRETRHQTNPPPAMYSLRQSYQAELNCLPLEANVYRNKYKCLLNIVLASLLITLLTRILQSLAAWRPSGRPQDPLPADGLLGVPLVRKTRNNRFQDAFILLRLFTFQRVCIVTRLWRQIVEENYRKIAFIGLPSCPVMPLALGNSKNLTSVDR